MKFVADENVDKQIVESLRTSGNEILYVLEIQTSISDDAVIQLANKENALLITADKDFGELVFRQGRITNGVVLIRLSGLPAEHKADIVTNTIRNLSNELPGNFTVITPGVTRIRKQHS